MLKQLYPFTCMGESAPSFSANASTSDTESHRLKIEQK